MALIKCSECGHEISSNADSCPRCGCKTLHAETNQARNIAKILYIFGVIIQFVGLVLCILHAKDFFENSEAGKETVYFGLGLGLIVASFIMIRLAKKKSEEVEEQEELEQFIEMSAQRAATSRWTCRCGRKNADYISTCSCGINRREMKK